MSLSFGSLRQKASKKLHTCGIVNYNFQELPDKDVKMALDISNLTKKELIALRRKVDRAIESIDARTLDKARREARQLAQSYGVPLEDLIEAPRHPRAKEHPQSCDAARDGGKNVGARARIDVGDRVHQDRRRHGLSFRRESLGYVMAGDTADHTLCPGLKFIRRRPEGPYRPDISEVELRGFEPLTFSLRTRRATNCATAPEST
jgi:hypothetical protein